MTIFRRDTLAAAFPNNPRLISDLEALDDLLTSADTATAELRALLVTAQTQIAQLSGDWQPASTILDMITGLNGEAGSLELEGTDQVTVRPIDTTDGASLLTRARGVINGGKGATGSRPTLGSVAGIYFDTTLAAAGKPIFWTGTAWVDSTGAVV
jgi:hypothetical protein